MERVAPDPWTIDTKRATAAARARLEAALIERSIGVAFIVRVKSFAKANIRGHDGSPANDVLGCYRSHSGRNGKPIFWINESFPDIVRRHGLYPEDVEENLLDTLAHEYGHFVFEWSQWVDPEVGDVIVPRFGSSHEDEENFAETFGRAIAGRITDHRVDEIVSAFAASCLRIFV